MSDAYRPLFVDAEEAIARKESTPGFDRDLAELDAIIAIINAMPDGLERKLLEMEYWRVRQRQIMGDFARIGIAVPPPRPADPDIESRIAAYGAPRVERPSIATLGLSDLLRDL